MQAALASSAKPAAQACRSSGSGSRQPRSSVWKPSQEPLRRQLRQQPGRGAAATSGTSPAQPAQPAEPLPPYYQLSLPVYSLATVGPGGASPTMNLVTYAAPISLKPRHYALGLYLNTLSWENMLATRTGVLQVGPSCPSGQHMCQGGEGHQLRRRRAWSLGSDLLFCSLLLPAGLPVSGCPLLSSRLSALPAHSNLSTFIVPRPLLQTLCRSWASSMPPCLSCWAAPAGETSTSSPSSRNGGSP